MSDQQVDVPVKVMVIMSHYKRDPSEVAFRYPSPQPVREIEPREIDPDYVVVQLLFQGEQKRDFVLNMVLSTGFAKQLNLMAGDKLTLKLIKDSK